MSNPAEQNARQPPDPQRSSNSEGSVNSEAAQSIEQRIRMTDIRFLIVAGAVFFAVMVTQYVLLVLDKPTPIPWQQGETARLFQIDVNDAAWAEWTQLDNLGGDLAMRIVADRDANGPFQTIDDLLRVEGIGRTTLDRIRPSLTISYEPANKQK